MEQQIIFEFLDGRIFGVTEDEKADYLKTGNFKRTDTQNHYEYWYEVKEKTRDKTHISSYKGVDFTLEFLDGHREKFNNYNSFLNRSDELQIKMNKKRTKLVFKGKTFVRRPNNFWVESSGIKKTRGTKFTLEFKDGHKEEFQNYSNYTKRTDDYKITLNEKLYFQGKVFKKTAKNYWVEERNTFRDGCTTKFKLKYLNGTVLECSNKSKFVPLTQEECMIYRDRYGLYYKGVWFIQDKNNKRLYNEKKDNFNIYKDKFYLLKDDKVIELENMESYVHRDDEEKIMVKPLKILDYFEYKPPHTNKKPFLVRRYMIYNKQVYYNVDYLKTWVSSSNIKEGLITLHEEVNRKIVNETLLHTNGNEITTFKKNGVYTFTPEKFQRNYQLYRELGGMVKFKSGVLCYYNDEVYEKFGTVWVYCRKAIDAEKANKKLLELKQEEDYIINEINYLRTQGFKIYYKWVKCDFRQPNTITHEERKNKVKNKSRAKRKKALQQKKKRKGKYKEKRGIVTYE